MPRKPIKTVEVPVHASPTHSFIATIKGKEQADGSLVDKAGTTWIVKGAK